LAGSPGYIAPEIALRKPYDTKSDIFSLGVIMYILLCGYQPFYNENEMTLVEMSKNPKWNFESSEWNETSEEAKELITKMMEKGPDKRINATNILEHKWIKDFNKNVKGLNKSNTLQNMREFNVRRKFKNAMYALMGANNLA
ncbi:MAG: Calcium/calmodulin-dependent protein kinase type II subunit gamma, partial [Paramarteilia canceri]